jgi:hypothetical protein
MGHGISEADDADDRSMLTGRRMVGRDLNYRQ